MARLTAERWTEAIDALASILALGQRASFLRHTRTEERPSAKPPRDLAAAEPDMRGVGEEGDAP